MISMNCRLGLAQHFCKIFNAPKANIRYTKQYFEDLNIDKDLVQKKEQQAKLLQHKQSVYNIRNNDRNEKNLIKNIRINSPAIDTFKKFEQEHKVKSCWILTPQPKKPRVFLSARRKYIITSIKKAKNALYPLRKLYLYDAIYAAESSQKKVAKLIVPTLYNLIRHANDRDFDAKRLFIHGIQIGKTMRYKGIRYHARGKTGREKKDFCQVKIILYEKDEEEFWKDIGTGHVPPSLGAFVRQRLLQMQANHEKIMDYTGITTSKGRQQKREIIKRKVALKMLQNKEAGTYVPKKVIQKQIYEEEGRKAKQLFQNLKNPDEVSQIKKRQILFKTNQENA